MILAFDTSSAACTAALFEDGACIGRADEQIGRGHAERLVPMLEELLAGRRPKRIIVGVGPGSFTGIRVAIAAAHGLAIGWDCDVTGMSSLGLIAAGVDGAVGVAVLGGHGELFVQQFDEQLHSLGLHNAAPAEAAAWIGSELVIGSGAAALVDARGFGEAREGWPAAADAMRLPDALRNLPPKPTYGRSPDARAKVAA